MFSIWQEQFYLISIFFTYSLKRKKAQPVYRLGLSLFVSGGVLLSHTVTHAVPSALKDFTSVFEMGTGVAPSL